MWVPDRNSSGTVVGETSPRSIIVTAGDATYRRNRQHLIGLPESEPAPESEGDTETQEPESQPARDRSSRNRKAPDRYDPSWT